VYVLLLCSQRSSVTSSKVNLGEGKDIMLPPKKNVEGIS
jgi:hypothetical protein